MRSPHGFEEIMKILLNIKRRDISCESFENQKEQQNATPFIDR